MTITTRAPGDLLTAAIFNTKIEAPIVAGEIQDGAITTVKIADSNVTVAKLAAIPAARVYHNVDQSIATATTTALAFNSERFDTDTMHDTATNNTRLTCRMAGKYLIFGTVSWAPSGAGVRILNIRHNGTTAIASDTRPNVGAGSSQSQAVATSYDLAVNDYVELTTYQDSGGALTAQSISNYSPEFGLIRLGA